MGSRTSKTGRNPWAWWIGAVAAFVAVVVLFPSTSFACSCAPLPPVDDYMRNVKLAFWGEVVNRRVERSTVIAEVEPRRTYRGKPGKLVTVHSAMPCGMDLEVGKTYTLTLMRSGDGDYHVGSCGYSSYDEFPPAKVGERGVRDLAPVLRQLERPLRDGIAAALADCKPPDRARWTAGDLTLHPGGAIAPSQVRTNKIAEDTRPYRHCVTRALLTRLELPDVPDAAVGVQFNSEVGGPLKVTIHDASKQKSAETEIRLALQRKPELVADSWARLEAMKYIDGVRKQQGAALICEYDGYAAAVRYVEEFTDRLDERDVLDVHRGLASCALRHDDPVGAARSFTALEGEPGTEIGVLLPILNWAASELPQRGLPLTSDGVVFPGDSVDDRLLINWAGANEDWLDAPMMLEALARALTTARDGTHRSSPVAALALRRAGMLRPNATQRYDVLARQASPDGVDEEAFAEMKKQFDKARLDEARLEALAAEELEIIRSQPAEESAPEPEVVFAETVVAPPPVVEPEEEEEEEEPLSPWWVPVGLIGLGYAFMAFRRRLQRPA